jgi:hypothetical protein
LRPAHVFNVAANGRVRDMGAVPGEQVVHSFTAAIAMCKAWTTALAGKGPGATRAWASLVASSLSPSNGMSCRGARRHTAASGSPACASWMTSGATNRLKCARRVCHPLHFRVRHFPLHQVAGLGGQRADAGGPPSSRMEGGRWPRRSDGSRANRLRCDGSPSKVAIIPPRHCPEICVFDARPCSGLGRVTTACSKRCSPSVPSMGMSCERGCRHCA